MINYIMQILLILNVYAKIVKLLLKIKKIDKNQIFVNLFKILYFIITVILFRISGFLWWSDTYYFCCCYCF